MLEETPRQRAFGLRLLRSVAFLNSVAIIALAALLVFAFHTIQASRVETIRRACQEQNARHDQTVRTLDRLIAQSRREGGSRARRAQRSRASTLLFISALAPRADCDARARRLTQ